MMHRSLVVVASALLLLAPTAAAVAQPAPIPTVTPPRIGDCTIRVAMTNPPARGWLKIDVNMESVAQKRIDKDSTTVAVAVKGPILDGDRVRARVVVDGMSAGDWSNFAQAVAGTGVNECRGNEPSRDDRDAFQAGGYTGIAYDNFAAPQSTGYKVAANSDSPGTSSTRVVAGVDAEGRIFGKPGDNVQLWWFGETLYGVRSQDIPCSDQPTLCKDPSANSVTTSDVHYILAHATSMEFFLGPRLELWTLQKDTPLPAKLYVTARLGYLALASSAAKTTAMHHVGGGVLAPSGPFEGSFVELGLGKTESLSPNWNRFKIDAYLTFGAPGVLNTVLKKASARMFVELFVDKSTDTAPDSIQTFVGFEYEINKWFGK